MRFISWITQYKLMAVHQGYEVLATGQGRVTSPGYTVEFRPHDATHAEREQARRSFQYRGLVTAPGSEKELDPIDVQHRVSTFDTNVIADSELRARVEKALLNNPDFGRDYVLADEPVKLPPPWPAYDKLVAQGRRTLEMVVEKIKAQVDEAGYDPVAVIAYERENLNRPEVIAALEPQTADEPDVELVSA